MSKLKEAQQILLALGLPQAQQSSTAAYTLLALADVDKGTPWCDSKKRSIGIRPIMKFVKDKYGKAFTDRERFRRQIIHQFEQARVVDRNPDDPSLATNHPKTHYALSDAAFRVIRAFGTPAFALEAENFIKAVGSLSVVYRAARDGQLIPVSLPTGNKLLSPGAHNILQVAILNDFASRFAPGSLLLYFGDTARKDFYIESAQLKRLGIPATTHDKLPDVVLHLPSRNWLLLIEAVTSHGPVSPKRKLEMEKLLKDCPLQRVYVSAFPDFKEFKRHIQDIAWETEVWIAEIKDHLIHYNGDKFLGPGQLS